MSAAGPRLSPAPIRRPDDGGQDSDQEREIDRETAQGGAPPRVRPGAPTRRPAQVPPAAGRRPLPAPGPVSGPWPVVAIASASSRRLTRRARQEEGAGTAMSLAVIAVALSLALGAIGLIQAQGASGRARLAADLAALAGATVLSSVLAPGSPCAMAEHVARANGARVTSCRVSGEDVRVDVVVPATVLGVARQARASARAGPVNTLL